MAETVEQMPHTYSSRLRYPWDEWLDGQVWKLTLGVDCNKDASAAVSLARYHAARRGGNIRSRKRGEHLFIQFYKEQR